MFSIRRLAFPLAVLCTFAAISAVAADDQAVKLQKGDRIVFLGDSITQGGGGEHGYITLVSKALEKHHKDLGIEVVNAGISGNKVPDLQARLKKDVLDKKPTIVMIYIGINDVWHGENDPAKGTTKERFAAGLKDIIKQIQDGGARVILCTPSVIGEKKPGTNKLDAKLDEYSDISRAVAKDAKVPLCDLRKAFQDHETANNKDDRDQGVLTGDRVHLNEAGNRLVADAMLKMFGD
jgi:lysophospholipase L1-like esterase